MGCSTSEQMRKEMKLAMARGDSDDVILAGFVGKYGPTVLSAPTTTGFNRVAWIMPVVIFLAALGAVVLVVRAWKKRKPQDPTNSGGAPPEELDEFRRRAREETRTLIALLQMPSAPDSTGISFMIFATVIFTFGIFYYIFKPVRAEHAVEKTRLDLPL